VWLMVPGTEPAPAIFDQRQISTDRVSSVQYIKFQLSPEQVARFPRGASLRVDHPHYNTERVFTTAELAELAEDLK
jgi:hypothetical protein